MPAGLDGLATADKVLAVDGAHVSQGKARFQGIGQAAIRGQFNALAFCFSSVLVTGATANGVQHNQFILGVDLEHCQLQIGVAAQPRLKTDFVLLAGRRIEVEAESAIRPRIEQLVEGGCFEALAPAGVKAQLRGKQVADASIRRVAVVGDLATVIAVAASDVLSSATLNSIWL